MKTILVSGGSGFLGSNLCHALIRNGDRVICLDNNYTGRMENIADLLPNPNFRFVHHDVIYPYQSDEEINQIYNLACPASPRAYQGIHAIETTKTCVMGAANMLDLAKKHNAVILQASTSEIYGQPQVHPQTEDYKGNVNPIGIRSCYDEGKRCAESIFFDYYRNENVRIKVVRIFNTYGPNMDPDDGRVVSNFICQALSGKDITIYGDGMQTRSFCYVDDLVAGLIKMMNSADEIVGPMNLGNPIEYTMLELAQKVLQKISNQAKIVYQDLPSDDPIKRRPNISLAKKLLDWEPKILLDEGLDKTIAYFQQRLDKKD